MKYRRLGRTGLKVSIVGIGAWQFGGDWGKDFTQQEVDEILARGKEAGINLIDTAECYGNHLSETWIGGYLARGGNRPHWIVATKFGHRYGDRGNTGIDYFSAGEVRKQLEDSLQSLRTDYIDIYQFHSAGNDRFDNDDLWTMLDKQVQAGKIRHLGISIGSAAEHLHQVDSASKVKVDVIQVIYNRLDQIPEAHIFPSCARQDLGVLARVPLASGYLSGKYKPGAVFPDNDVRSLYDRAETDALLRRAEEIRRSEVPEGTDMAEWSLAWCLKHPAVTCVIPGCKSPQQVDGNARAARFDWIDGAHPQAWREYA